MIRSILVSAALGLCLAGCGSTGGEGERWLVFQPVLFAEGTVVSDVPTGGATTEVLLPPPIQVGAGLGASPRIHRGVYAYDISSLPAAAVIDSAMLFIPQYAVIGTPYGSLGNLLVDHVDIGPGLDPSDFDGGTIYEAFETLSTSPELAQYSVTVKGRLEVDLYNGRTESSYRIYFAQDESATVNQHLVSLADGQGGAPGGILPILRVEYKISD